MKEWLPRRKKRTLLPNLTMMGWYPKVSLSLMMKVQPQPLHSRYPAAAAKAWAEKIDSDPRDVRAKSSGGTPQVPTLKRPMLKVPNHPEPE
eukprot:2322441-Amphidinium_carterae.1